MIPVPRRNKYGNRKVRVDGILFDSEAEAIRYGQLKLMENAGSIAGLTLQPVFVLAPSVIMGGRKKPPLRYLADFAYYENGQLIVEDVKGCLTDVYRVKRHLMRSVHGIEIRETGKRRLKWKSGQSG